MLALLLACADTSKTSKVNPMLYPQETRLEKFFGDIETKRIRTKRVFGTRKKIKAVCSWHGITCDASGEVEAIKWWDIRLNGQLDVAWFPHSVAVFMATSTSLKGTWDFAALSPKLREFNVSINFLKGTLDVTVLPANLHIINLGGNLFSGSIDLSKLQSEVQDLDLSDNNFWGSIDLENLPQGLISLNLSHNEFSGSADFFSLPPNICNLSVRSNNLSGDILLERVPQHMELFDISQNDFTGYVDLSTAPIFRNPEADVDISQNQLTVSGRDEVSVHHNFIRQAGEHEEILDAHVNVMR